jgi:hypothetical protein
MWLKPLIDFSANLQQMQTRIDLLHRLTFCIFVIENFKVYFISIKK